MSQDKDDGGSAFPSTRAGRSEFAPIEHKVGMTLRVWLAGQAVVGLLAHSCDQDKNLINESASQVAIRAFQVADAMLEEMKK